ncbi:MAG TPA: hypothetical protein VK752_29330 [Bryobacteraceae bacterium]|jgi:hypothetical protein|nr:hypothetical protein [Bryobacteraceae bacterium]
MRLSGNPLFLLPLANCSKNSSILPGSKIRFSVGSQLKLTATPGCLGIDVCRSQPLQMIVMLPWIYHMSGLIAALKPVLYERKQYAVRSSSLLKNAQT